jgi:hypothetical protein
MSRTLNIAITISLCGHLLGFTFIHPYLKDGLQKMDTLKIFFLGALFRQQELYPDKEVPDIFMKENKSFAKRIPINLNTSSLSPSKYTDFFYYSIDRSLFNVNIEDQKTSLYPKQNIRLPKKDASLMFYPYLPYSFILYFKDRQKANLEFLFYISEGNRLSSLKRKTSCGNLEIDLTVMRYINRSLYLIKDSFPLNSWQSVKIELKRKDVQD